MAIGKTFKHYLEFPSEVRSMVIGEMSLKDRCRFTRCSSLCQKEVQESKNYVRALQFVDSSQEILEIKVSHGTNHHFFYQLLFQSTPYKKCIKYLIPSDFLMAEVWSIDLDSSIDLVQLATEKFKKLLELYQNSIEILQINGKRDYGFEVRSLKNLRILELNTRVGNVMEVISRRQKPLEFLTYNGEMNERLLESPEYIYNVQKDLNIPKLKLNIDEFRRLSAEKVVIHVEKLLPIDIANFITSWKNGQLHENFRQCYWELTDSDFDLEELWGLLRLTPVGQFRKRFEIEHNNEAGKVAILCHFYYRGTNKLYFGIQPAFG